MSLRMEEAQRHTDEQGGWAEQRKAAHRFAVQDWTLIESRKVDDKTTAHTYYIPPTSLDPWWDAHLLKREQIEREEKAEFNKRYNYAP